MARAIGSGASTLCSRPTAPDVIAYCGWRATLDDAEDAMVEVFLTAWRRLDEGRRAGPGDPG